jgi:hypothetical protein
MGSAKNRVAAGGRREFGARLASDLYYRRKDILLTELRIR